MPELDGFQVVQAVREREQVAGGHLPVIALTALATEDRERCLAAGMDDFLSKPSAPRNCWRPSSGCSSTPEFPAIRPMLGTAPACSIRWSCWSLRRRCAKGCAGDGSELPGRIRRPDWPRLPMPSGMGTPGVACGRSQAVLVCCRRSPQWPVALRSKS